VSLLRHHTQLQAIKLQTLLVDHRKESACFGVKGSDEPLSAAQTLFATKGNLSIQLKHRIPTWSTDGLPSCAI